MNPSRYQHAIDAYTFFRDTGHFLDESAPASCSEPEYRFLEEGETIRDGDEYFHDAENAWLPTSDEGLAHQGPILRRRRVQNANAEQRGKETP